MRVAGPGAKGRMRSESLRFQPRSAFWGDGGEWTLSSEIGPGTAANGSVVTPLEPSRKENRGNEIFQKGFSHLKTGALNYSSDRADVFDWKTN